MEREPVGASSCAKTPSDSSSARQINFMWGVYQEKGWRSQPADAEPPPDTLTWFVTCEGALAATLTVTVIGG